LWKKVPQKFGLLVYVIFKKNFPKETIGENSHNPVNLFCGRVAFLFRKKSEKQERGVNVMVTFIFRFRQLSVKGRFY
jgi:hypothetical protein